MAPVPGGYSTLMAAPLLVRRRARCRPRPLHELLAERLDDPAAGWSELAGAEPLDERDALLALLAVHDLWTAPLDAVGERARLQGHPEVACIKSAREDSFVAQLDRLSARDPAGGSDGAVVRLRRVAARDLVPPVYDWLAGEATWPQLVRFLALEGGPDGGFDDLVAVAQVGIAGDAKVALAENYWDELGRGEPDDVHTELHRRLVRAAGLPAIPRTELPVAALRRAALNGLLATNRYLQPEMLGALGLLEMQAGPRCRAVVRALRRLGAPRDTFAFYEEHARADPRHGKEWLERVVEPLAEDPRWAAGMVRGAEWRSAVNRRFFADAHERCLLVDRDVAATPLSA